MDNLESFGDFAADLHGMLKEPKKVEETFESIKTQLSIFEKDREEDKLNAKKLVQDLVKLEHKCSSLKAKLDLVDADVANSIKDLEKKKKLAEEQQALLTSKQQASSEVLERQKAEREKVVLQEQTVKKAHETELEKLRVKLRFYRHIAKLRLNQNADPGLCEGYIIQKNDTKPFSLRKAELSNFFVANYLWNLMDETDE